MSLLISKNIFNEYFELLYKIEYDYQKSHSINKTNCNLMDTIISNIKMQIKNIFDVALQNNKIIKTKEQFHKLCYLDYDDNNGPIESNWIRTNNKIKLYRYLLFGSDSNSDSNSDTNLDLDLDLDLACLSKCIDYWFSEGSGYWNNNSRINENHMHIDSCTNINLIDNIGTILKTLVGQGIIYEPSEIEEIYTYKKNNKKQNFEKYKNQIQNYNRNLNLNFNLEFEFDSEYIDLIKLFDIFFRFGDENNNYSTSKLYNSMWIKSENNIYIDLDTNNK